MAILDKETLSKFKDKAKDLKNRAIDQHVNLAVTGLSRSGKTAFITSIVNQLLHHSNGAQLDFFEASAQKRLIGTKRVPQQHLYIPRFEYEKAIEQLSNETPSWPVPTSGISEIRLAIRYQPKQSLLKYATDSATLYVDITDYPGEWLLDLPMLSQTFEEWSRYTSALLREESRNELSKEFFEKVEKLDPFQSADEELLADIADSYTQLLHKFRNELGLSVIQPGRFILPGELAGAPILQFFPFTGFENLDEDEYQNADDASCIGMLRARFIEYKERVIKKFYQQHFVKFDRQIILADCLSPLNRGKYAFDDLQHAITLITESFNYGQSNILKRLFSPKIDKLLFAATKVDHITQDQHGNLQSLLEQLMYPIKQRVNFDAVEMESLAMASIRATRSGQSDYEGKKIQVIQGSKLNTDKTVTLFPGSVPNSLPDEAFWQDKPFDFIDFAPQPMSNPNDALKHIRMDQAIEFLLGDKLK